MAKKKQNIPAYGTAEINGVTYFRTRITDADGKRVPIYASTCEELYKKEQDARQQVQDILFRKQNPTVEDYCERWLLMRSATVTQDTLRNYRREMYKYIVEPLGNLYLSDVTADDIKLALVPVSKRAKHTFDTVNMLIKSVFYSAERSEVIDYNPAAKISAKGGVPGKPMDALTDEQVKKLVDAVKGLPPYVFVMLGLYAGLRREESLALQWDCVFLDTPTPYISVRRAWRGSHRKEPEISTVLKTPASRRDIPIPKCLVECLREAKRSSKSAFVISNRKGGPLSEGEFVGVWYHVKNHTAGEKINYKYVNGEHIRYTTCPILGSHRKGSPNHVYDVNFTIPQNTTTAIVGPSGSGKSTLCSLIARFYDVDAGKITLGETDIREFTCDSLLKNISMVFQNVYLFRDTIRNNIKFGSPDASEEQMIAAAKEARCHDFIMALPDGYDTVIGEGGSSLSGGEKQRISIARAMLKDAPIVILDEATASIDPENEHLIQEAISALTHGKTIITIAHRLATIENADQILVIDGGTVVQKGTHKELLAQRGTYQEFIKIREQAEGWRIQQ